jgi:hypothetical protein
MSTRPTANARYLPLADVVERYGGNYSAWTLREKARRGELPHVKHPGAKAILFREDWLDAFDEGCELERQVVRQRGLSPGRIVRPRRVRRQEAA